jgi:hypothetical protein
MNIANFLNDKRFNMFFSFMLGVGIICIIRPICSGSDCSITKPPTDKEFDKYVYKMSGNKCYEFKSEVIECPNSGTIEAFRECPLSETKNEPFRDQFTRRNSPIKRCE